ncbi:MAG: hypothetical protein EOO71_08965 [Myxococcaceae bacterium]|nr:MAG: hypothetical protein EOO71_08965 [Myxococcaceae bacterium]
MNILKYCFAGMLPALLLVACEKPGEGAAPEPELQSVKSRLLTGSDSLSNVHSDQKFTGANGSRAGAALASGLLNADSLSDIVVGAPGPSSGTFVSKVYVLHGKTNAEIRTASLQIEGVSAYRAGASLSLGNYTGNSRSDLLIGAPGYSLNRGAAYLLDGATLPSTTVSLSSSKVIPGQATNDGAGFAVALGNVVGGGDADLIVGAPNRSTGSGAIYVIQGPLNLASLPSSLGNATTSIVGAAGNPIQAGTSLSTADLNGDGRADLLVGAPKYNGTGAVFVFFGPLPASATPLSLTNANLTLLGTTANELAGTSIARLGDIDGDGDEEVLVGAPGSGSLPGKTYLVYGGSTGTVALATSPQFVGSPGDLSGTSVARVGDADGDGYTDFLIGAPGAAFGAGAAYLIHGGLTPFTGSQPLSNYYWFTGEAAGDGAGTAVASAGDVDGDGRDDLVIGAPGAGAGKGSVYLMTLHTWYEDTDGDGHGDANKEQDSYFAPTAGNWVTSSDDCDDSNWNINPAALEVCNAIDDNCNGLIDAQDPELGGAVLWVQDKDNDLHIDPDSVAVLACSAPPGSINLEDALGFECLGIYSDNDPSTYEGAEEVCDTKDNNCEGSVDEGVTTRYYKDLDDDTFGDPVDSIQACSAPAGYVESNSDCDDTRSTVNPSAIEVCNGLDDNCDTKQDVNATWYADLDQDGFGSDAPYPPLVVAVCGSAPVGYANNKDDCNDRNPLVVGPKEWHLDSDGDGFGDASKPIKACTQPAGYVANDKDCDDLAASVTEIFWYADADADGFGNRATPISACSGPPAGYVALDTDCNDTTALVSPLQTEVCNGVDDNCTNGVDEGVKSTWYHDGDGDGFGDPMSSVQACSAPAGYLADSSDCNDASASINPDTTWYVDTDSDGFGVDAASNVKACVRPTGYSAVKTDCDDNRNTTHPGALEFCNGVDDDCNSTIDDSTAVDTATWFQDSDGDGHGGLSKSTKACSKPAGYASSSDDCNDSNKDMFPGNAEVCDGLDNNCDFEKDEDVKSTFYQDSDGDGFGTPLSFKLVCSAPTGYVSNNQDCNDTNGNVAPGHAEVCNGVDDNCDGVADDGVKVTYYADLDGDGFGTTNPAYTVQACSPPAGYTSTTGDCDDRRNEVSPTGTEVCDLLDNNCDGTTDEGVQLTWYQDADGDGFGTPGATTLACFKPTGYAGNTTDCDDSRSDVSPANVEVCEAPDAPQVDNDCDANVNDAINVRTWYEDEDEDGFGLKDKFVLSCTPPLKHSDKAGDCDDTLASVRPDALETCESSGPQIDNNCNGDLNDDPNAPIWYGDGDGDNYAGTTFELRWCTNPSNLKDPNGNVLVRGHYVASLIPTDCNDSNASISPGATEVCNLIDDNCNSQTDEGTQIAFYPDTDNDGCGANVAPSMACYAPGTCGFGFVTNHNDTNDNDSSVCL